MSLVWISNRLRAVPQDGHTSEKTERSKKQEAEGKLGRRRLSPVSLLAISLSPVLPSLDSTDWKETAHSLNFKHLLLRVLWRKPCSCQCLLLYLCFSLSLLPFQPIFVSFVAISAVMCHLLEFTLTGPYSSHLGFKSVKSNVRMSIKSNLLEVGDKLEGGKKNSSLPLHSQLLTLGLHSLSTFETNMAAHNGKVLNVGNLTEK